MFNISVTVVGEFDFPVTEKVVFTFNYSDENLPVKYLVNLITTYEGMDVAI